MTGGDRSLGEMPTMNGIRSHGTIRGIISPPNHPEVHGNPENPRIGNRHVPAENCGRKEPDADCAPGRS